MQAESKFKLHLYELKQAKKKKEEENHKEHTKQQELSILDATLDMFFILTVKVYSFRLAREAGLEYIEIQNLTEFYEDNRYFNVLIISVSHNFAA